MTPVHREKHRTFLAKSGPQQRPFRFFDLPRELRNLVYSNLTRDVCVAAFEKAFRGGLFVGISDFACLLPLLANRQFSEEYKKEMGRTQRSEVFLSVINKRTSHVPTNLDLNDNAKIVLSKIKRMNVDFEIGVVHRSFYELAAILPFLTSLETAIVRPSRHFNTLYQLLYRDPADPVAIGDPWIRRYLSRERPHLKIEVITRLHGPLFSSWTRDGDTLDRCAQTYQEEHHAANEIVFEARLATGPYTFLGLDLEVSPGDHGNTFEGVLADIKSQEARRPGWLMASWLSEERVLYEGPEWSNCEEE